MKYVQCYELFGGIALKNYAFSFFQSCHLPLFLMLPDLNIGISLFEILWHLMRVRNVLYHFLFESLDCTLQCYNIVFNNTDVLSYSSGLLFLHIV